MKKTFQKTLLQAGLLNLACSAMVSSASFGTRRFGDAGIAKVIGGLNIDNGDPAVTGGEAAQQQEQAVDQQQQSMAGGDPTAAVQQKTADDAGGSTNTAANSAEGGNVVQSQQQAETPVADQAT